MENINYRKDLEIDDDALDVEWNRQSMQYMKYAELSAEADRDCQKAKEQCEVVEAQVDSKIRERARVEDIKITEASIKAEIKISPEYQKAKSEYLQADYQAQILSAAVKAFDHRKKALEHLSQLWLAGYFSSPRQPKAKEGVEKRQQERQRNALNKSKEG